MNKEPIKTDCQSSNPVDAIFCTCQNCVKPKPLQTAGVSLEVSPNDMAGILLLKTFEVDCKHKPYSSLHEAYGLLMEEIREFETEVFAKEANRSPEKIRAELMDIMVVCARAYNNTNIIQIVEQEAPKQPEAVILEPGMVKCVSCSQVIKIEHGHAYGYGYECDLCYFPF